MDIEIGAGKEGVGRVPAIESNRRVRIRDVNAGEREHFEAGLQFS